MAGSMCSASLLCLLEAHASSAPLASSLKALWQYFTAATQEVLLQCVSVGYLPLLLTHHLQAPLVSQTLCVLHLTDLRGWVCYLWTLGQRLCEGAMPPTPNVYCIPERFCYLVCNEEGAIPLPRVKKGVLRLCLESLEVARRRLESLQAHTNCHQDFWNCFSPWIILLYINHLQEYIFKIVT